MWGKREERIPNAPIFEHFGRIVVNLCPLSLSHDGVFFLNTTILMIVSFVFANVGSLFLFSYSCQFYHCTVDSF